VVPATLAPERAPRPLRRCFSDRPAWQDSLVADLLDRAHEFLDTADNEGALACAEEAARQTPRSLEAHVDRAMALARLSRLEEAREVVTLALALAPQDPEVLEVAADLYVNQLPPSAERTAIGLEYARRGGRTVSPRDRQRAGSLALLEGQALIDLGRSADALRPLASALKHRPDDGATRYEQGVALFELCRFDESRTAFERVLATDPRHAHATYHLGLVAERAGDADLASRSFAAATLNDPKAFPALPPISATEFAAVVRAKVAALPPDVLTDLGQVPVTTAEMPDVEDLIAESPPLSPTILGLYRGLPLGRDPDGESASSAGAGRIGRGHQARAVVPHGASKSAPPERAIVLYRRNILRSTRHESELARAVERTLLHEIGHLRGEDDGSLRDRGLE
jgi:Flp pilus assembly protein TadD/predicted Zn-dependent protease with MMP-like domain